MAIGTSQAFRTQNLRLLGNLFDKNNFIGKKGYYLNSTGDGVDWRADLNENSGIFYGGVISATIGGTTFNITAGSGQVITRALVNNDIVTTNKIVSWNAQNNIALTYRTTHQFSYIYIDENGALQQQNSSFTDAEYQNKIIIGVICHINLSTINLVSNKQNIAYGDSHRIYELANSFGPIKRSGLTISAYSTNLRISRGSGSVFSIGCNYASDQFDADSPNISSANPALLCRVYKNGSGGFVFDVNSGSYYTDIDPNNYDNGSGTLQTVNNNQWTIQRLFFFPNNPSDIITYYGCAIYNSYNDAIAAIPTESFSEATITSENAVFLGYLIIRGGATNLSLSADGVFFQSGAFRNVGTITGGGGTSVANLDDLTDVLIATPLGGQFLTYDSTTSLWKNRSYILDANNNELIKFPSTVASAVNELTISNAATTGSPSISATGDDTNIGLNLISKGTGLVQINGKAISLANSFTTSGNFALTFTTTATTSLTLPTSGTLATTSQIPTVYDNTLTLAGSGGISLSATPTFTANASADKTITISIADGALTIAKLENIATSRILGRTSPSTGPVEVLDGTGVVSVIGTNAVTRATNLAGGSAGQIPYQSGANTTAFSAAGSTNQVLLSGGSGAPTWADQSSLSVGSATTAGSVANALTISSPLTGTSYNGSTAVSIGLQNASDIQAGGVSIGAQTFAGNKTFKDNVIVSGNLTVNGTTVTINSSTLSVDDKNIELGSVVAIPSLSATVNIDAGDTNVTVSSTSGLIVGQALTKISGTGAFGANPVISSITSATQFTVSPVHATTGSIVFSVGGATDVTADGGGITLKGTTDKTIIWVDSTDAWTLSEHLNIASGKSYRINGTDVLSSTTLGSGVINSSLTSVGTLTNLTVTNAITGSVSGSAGSLSGTYTFWGQSFNGTQNVSGNLTSVGNITGTGGITITAGGSNQNVVLTPSGTGYTLLNGNVGIGTSSPAAPLDVVGSSLTAILRNTSATNYAGLRIFNDQNSAFRALEIDYAGSSYSGALITGGPTGESAAIVTTGAYPLSLGTNNNARLTILSGGNVGIGTTSPGNKLEVNGSSGATIQAIFQNSSTSGNYAYNGGIQLGNASNNQNSQIYHTSDGDNTLTFVSNYSSGTGNKFVFAPGGTERVRFQQNGNVGVGHTSPSNKLAVSGSSSIGSNYNIAAPTNGLIVEGSVGIGTTAPSNTIDINGTARIRSISAFASAATIFLTTDANGVLVSRTAAQVRSDIGAGTGNGSVTSVNGTGTVSGITLSGTVTTSGNLTLGGTLSVTPSNFASQTANTFLAAPDGAAGVPTFRTMVSADIPNDGIVTAKILNSNVTLAKIQNVAISTVLGNSSASAAQAPVEINMTTLATMLSGKTMDIVGNATNVTGVVAIANGGTGTATTTANAFFVGPNGSSGAPSFRVMATADIPASIITFAKIQDVAGPTLIGRISATAGPVAALSSANARTVIGATTVGSNLITLPDISVSDKFLRVNFADNTVSALDAAAFRTAIGAGTGNGTVTSVTGSGGLVSSGGTTPDISIATDGVTTAKILNSNVTYAKIQNVSATSRILGRISANAGVIEELTGANVATIIGANAIENATNVSITTDDSTNSSYYLYFGANASGNTALKASTKIRYNPNSGAFSATTKSFRIPHPTKSQHDLVYGSLESPYHGIRLTGKGKTSGNRAEIILPDYINVLVDKETIHIQLTPIKCAKILYIDDIIINDNKFIVKYDKSWYEKSKDVEFYWDFTAERKDVPKLIVEEKI